MIAVTGANSHLGRALETRLRARDAVVVGLSSHARDGQRSFVLGEPLPETLLAGVDALVHLAWDVAELDSADAWRRNVGGSTALLELAAAHGIAVVFVSSLAAYPGTRSAYGRQKLAVEEAVARVGGRSVRPGLVFGARAGGIFGSLRAQVARLPVVPVVHSPGRVQLVHQEDLADLLADAALGRLAPGSPVVAACSEDLSLEDVVRVIAAALGRRVRLLPVPWRPVHRVLRLTERAGLRLPFRADSVVSLAGSPAASVDAAVAERLRPFDASTAGDA
jgi:nucleoside-diphosphate-sugar epimerase